MAASILSSQTPHDGARDRRRFARVPFDGQVRIQGPGRTWSAPLIDLSLKGALVGCPEDWPMAAAGAHQIAIELEGTEGVAITMDATPVHLGDNRLGFRCDRIDLASASHLRRLVELNLGDPALLERELAALAGQQAR